MNQKSDSGTITHYRRHSAAWWRVTIDIPPLNIFGPANIPQMEEVVAAIEEDDWLKVVVVHSAVDGFFATHYDFLSPLEESTKFPASAGLHSRMHAGFVTQFEDTYGKFGLGHRFPA